MKKKLKVAGIVSILLIISVYLIYSYVNTGQAELVKNNDDEIYEEAEPAAETSKEIDNKNEIVVEVKGAIKNPDVYWLKEDNIVQDLIDKAGGLTENADTSQINRAEKLKNHELIIIPDKNSSIQGNEKINENVNILRKEKGNLSSDLININTADEKELDSLPGIGPSKAKDIISYREENGEFKSIEEIKNVKGIGDSSFEKLKDKITV